MTSRVPSTELTDDEMLRLLTTAEEQERDGKLVRFASGQEFVERVRKERSHPE